MDEPKLKNKVAVIAGGASGIGEAIAKKFASQGADIIILDIKDATKLANDLSNTNRIRADFIECDIGNYLKVKKACKEILEKYLKVDILVSAAGYGPKIALENLEVSQWLKTVDVNLNGTFYLIKNLIKNMIDRRSGNIIIIGSGTIISGSGGGLHYAATKTALYGIVKGLSYELLPKGIRSNIITPHIIDTPLLRTRYPDDPATNKKLASRIPLGRIGKPEEIANIALFLASDESDYICGADIIADGGALRYKS